MSKLGHVNQPRSADKKDASAKRELVYRGLRDHLLRSLDWAPLSRHHTAGEQVFQFIAFDHLFFEDLLGDGVEQLAVLAQDP